MGRPKKLSDDEMLKIIDSFYESNGNPAMLKCSFLEEYAVSLNLDVKAYDFRRNRAVRKRMEELRDLALLFTSTGSIAYKSMDIEALLDRNRTKTMLKNSLLELDETWRRIYERAAELSRKNEKLKADTKKSVLECEKLTIKVCELSEQIACLNKANSKVVLENRYLKKMIKTYLYPAIANEILKNENVLENIDTDVTQVAMEQMADNMLPSSFSKSVEADREIFTREESLLKRMTRQIHE